MIICPHDFMVRRGLVPTRDEIADAWKAAHRAFSKALRRPYVMSAGIVCGIPGAGKSTFARMNDHACVVLFDAVWSHRGQREAMATRIRRANRIPVATHLEAPIEVAIERVSKRAIWRRVPEAKMRAAAARFLRFPVGEDAVWQRTYLLRG